MIGKVALVGPILLALTAAASVSAPPASSVTEWFGLENVVNREMVPPAFAKHIVSFEESAFVSYRQRGTAAVTAGGAESAVHFKDGTVAGCDDSGTDTVVMYPSNPYTSYILAVYIEYVHAHRHLPPGPPGAALGAPDYLLADGKLSTTSALHYGMCTSNGYGVDDLVPGTYQPFMILHRHIPAPTQPSATDPFSVIEAARGDRSVDGFVMLGPLVTVRNADDYLYGQPRMLAEAYFKN